MSLCSQSQGTYKALTKGGNAGKQAIRRIHGYARVGEGVREEERDRDRVREAVRVGDALAEARGI